MDRGLEGEGSAALRAQAAFSSSHLYEQASQTHRWDAQKPEHISGDQWIEILGRDADQQRHPKLMHDITKLFIHYDDGSAQLNDEDKEMLEVAAIVHDWGKRASLNYETKTEDDLLIEQKLFSETYDTLVGPGDVKRKYIIEKAVFDRDTKLGNIFDAIERLSYIRTATIAFEAQQTTTDPVLASHLQWLAAGTASHHIIPLMEHAANYTPVRAYLEHITPAIDGIFTQVPPSIFTRHGQAQHEKKQWFNNAATVWSHGFSHAKPASKSGEDFNLTEGLNGTGRLIEDYGKLQSITKACRTLGMKTVLTSGSFDLMHIGHMRYLHKAKQYGDILVVGVDSDIKIKQRKGPDRPIVDEVERTQMLSHTRGVDFITLKQPSDKKWELIKAIKPDVLIATAETYSAEEVAELEEKYCGRVVVLEPQATTSTSARIRGLHVGWANKILRPVLEEMQEGVLLPETKNRLDEVLRDQS